MLVHRVQIHWHDGNFHNSNWHDGMVASVNIKDQRDNK